MTWFERIRRTAAEDWHFARLPGDGEPLTPDDCYVDTHLTSMRIADARIGKRRYYASAIGTVRVAVKGAREAAEFMTVTKPVALGDRDPAHLDRLVVKDQPLLGRVPYRGGGLAVDLGVFSMPSVDLLDPYLSLVGDVARLAGVSALAAAGPLLTTAKTALDLAFGAAANPTLEIGVSLTMPEPTTGQFCAVRLPRDDGRLSALRLGPDNRLELADGTALREPYLVFEIGRHERRDTWWQIEELDLRYRDIADAVRNDNQARARAALEVFGRAAVMSPDLTTAQGVRLRDEVTKQVYEAFPGTLTSASDAPVELPRFRDLRLYG